MDNKLTKLYDLSESLYSEDCPVIIAAGALYKLTDADEKILLQLKFKNIGEGKIIAVKVAVQTYDISGNKVDENFEHQYLDLNLGFNAEYTDPKGVQLETKTVRSFDVKITEVVFDDATVCPCGKTEFASLPSKRKIGENLESSLIEQYKRDVGKQAVCEPFEYKNLWFCCCGELNREDENCCHRCKTDKSKQFKYLDSALLFENKEAFEKEQKELAEKRAVASRVHKEAVRKKTIKGGIIVAVVLAIIIGAGIIIDKTTKNRAYNNAVAMLEAGNYSVAEDIFYDLGDYKDCDSKRKECIYQNGLALFEDGKFLEAIDEFERIPDYKDSKEQISLVEKEQDYQCAVSKIEKNDGGDLSSVRKVFIELDGYKDSEKYLEGFVERIIKCYQEEKYGYELSRENYFYYDKEGYLSKVTTTEGFNYTYEYSYSKDKRTVTVIKSYKLAGGSVDKSEYVLKFDDNANIVEFDDDTFTYEYNNDNSVSKQIGKQFTNLGEVVETETIYSYEGNNLAKTEKTYSLSSTVMNDIHYFYYDENNKVVSIQNDNFEPIEYVYGWFYAPYANDKSDLMTTLTASTMKMLP